MLVMVWCAKGAVERATTNEYVPVVLWHGMGDTCCNPFSMGHIKRLIEKTVPGIYVLSLMIGADIGLDFKNGFFMNVNQQIEKAHHDIAKDKNINTQCNQGFHAVGFSQGGQFFRGYAERHRDMPVRNLITMGGQHQGVFGFPNCPGISSEQCEELRDTLSTEAYDPTVQATSTQAEYWHDPTQEDVYRDVCVFLPDVNNDGSYNATYKANLQAVDNFVMVMFLNDTVVQPVESEWFGYYVSGQDVETQTLFESDLYQQDWLGLQLLNNTGRLAFLATEGDHLQFTDEWFVDNIITPYLTVPTPPECRT
jgi:palmitoyl-protein thioesterase